MDVSKLMLTAETFIIMRKADDYFSFTKSTKLKFSVFFIYQYSTLEAVH